MYTSMASLFVSTNTNLGPQGASDPLVAVGSWSIIKIHRERFFFDGKNPRGVSGRTRGLSRTDERPISRQSVPAPAIEDQSDVANIQPDAPSPSFDWFIEVQLHLSPIAAARFTTSTCLSTNWGSNGSTS